MVCSTNEIQNEALYTRSDNCFIGYLRMISLFLTRVYLRNSLWTGAEIIFEKLSLKALNKNDDIRESQISAMWQWISITIPLAGLPVRKHEWAWKLSKKFQCVHTKNCNIWPENKLPENWHPYTCWTSSRVWNVCMSSPIVLVPWAANVYILMRSCYVIILV